MNFWTPERRLQELLDTRGQTPRRSTCPLSPPAALPASFSPPMAPAPSSRSSRSPQVLLPRVCVLGLGFPPGITDRIYCVHHQRAVRVKSGSVGSASRQTERETEEKREERGSLSGTVRLLKTGQICHLALREKERGRERERERECESLLGTAPYREV
jgi:hypothetical protein